MLDNIFRGLFDSDMMTVISISDFLICVAVSLVLGMVLAMSYMFRSRHTKSFVMTLALLPAVVCVVIMMVNGNVGAGVAVAGAFSLVRFRSVPGTAREITMLFLAMGAGLICGMGYLGFALVFTLIMCLVSILYGQLHLGSEESYKVLNVTVPEDLNYSNIFDDIFDEYTSAHELIRVKTTNMGSLFRLTYSVAMKDAAREKEMIDAIRCRNGNLEISMARQENAGAEL